MSQTDLNELGENMYNIFCPVKEQMPKFNYNNYNNNNKLNGGH